MIMKTVYYVASKNGIKVEISKKAFQQLVHIDTFSSSVLCGDFARTTTYITDYGVTVKQVENFVAFTTQYYILDINA